MPRIKENVNPLEHKAAAALVKVCEAIEATCYYGQQQIPVTTERALHRAFRALKPAAIAYYGDNTPLVWDPPSFKFQKKEKK